MRRLLLLAFTSTLLLATASTWVASSSPTPTVRAASFITIGSAGPTTPQAAQLNDSMDVWFTSRNASVTLSGQVRVSGGFDCRSPSTSTSVLLAITLEQGTGARSFAQVRGICESNRTWTATLAPDLPSPLFVEDEPIEAHITLANVANFGEVASADAELINDVRSLRVHPAVTVNPDGTATVTGTYDCDADHGPTGDLTMTLTQQHDTGTASAGVTVQSETCPATNAPFTVTIAATSTTASTAATAPAKSRISVPPFDKRTVPTGTANYAVWVTQKSFAVGDVLEFTY
jgi:hypothetical protein